MDKSSPYIVTEWDWMQLQLNLYSLRTRSEVFSVQYVFRRPDDPIFNSYPVGDTVDVVCKILATQTKELERNKSSRDEQLEYYRDWVQAEKQQIRNVIDGLPTLRHQFEIETGVAFLIMRIHGMASTPICRFVGGDVIWLTP